MRCDETAAEGEILIDAIQDLVNTYKALAHQHRAHDAIHRRFDQSCKNAGQPPSP